MSPRPAPALSTPLQKLIQRTISTLPVLLAISCLATRASAQAVPASGAAGGLTPDQQQALQDQITQLRGIQDQVIQNMQNAGVDSQAFMQDIQQQMQDGTMDMAGLQQQLVQKGFMTQQMSDQLSGSLNQLQNTARSASLNAIRAQLNASDDEWAVLLPRIQRILDLKQALTMPSVLTITRGTTPLAGTGGLGGMALQPANNSDVAKAFAALQTVLKDQNAAEDRIKLALVTWRAAREKTQNQLTLAQTDLQNVLTLRQEAILLNAGLL